MKKSRVIPICLLMLVGCSGNVKKEKIDFRTAIGRLQEQERDLADFDRIGDVTEIKKMYFDYSSKFDDSETSIVAISAENLRIETVSSGWVNATNGNDLAAYSSFEGKKLSLSYGQIDETWNNISLKSYLSDSNLYIDLSNRELKQALISLGILPESCPDKVFTPVDFGEVEFPILSQEIIDEWTKGSGESDSTEIFDSAMQSDGFIETILENFTEVYVFDEGKDFEFNLNITKDSLVGLMREIVGETGDESFVDILEESLTSGGFEYIKASFVIDDYRMKKWSLDLNIGYSTAIVEEGTSLSSAYEKFKWIFKAEAKMSYGNEVVVPSLSDYDDFTRIDLLGSGD